MYGNVLRMGVKMRDAGAEREAKGKARAVQSKV